MLLRRHKVKNFTEVGAIEEVAPAPVVAKEEQPIEEPKEEKPEVTKTAVNRMSTKDLQKLGAEIGIEDASDKSGGTLKTEIIEKLGL